MYYYGMSQQYRVKHLFIEAQNIFVICSFKFKCSHFEAEKYGLPKISFCNDSKGRRLKGRSYIYLLLDIIVA